ncbi:type II toxin-antitoxin system HicA family toxin [Nostoc sp.]|uniref:type II toxin-antitoxin system HicA family toxin n=1 Tax=Nostoc sp. TaxID=1180 RepID=UPI003FA561F5
MSKFPSISGRDCVRAMEKVGFYEKRRESSHIILRKLPVNNVRIENTFFANNW